MAERISENVWNQAGKAVNLAAALWLAIAGFADRANAYTQWVCPEGAEFGIAYIHVPGQPYGVNELLVWPDGKACAVFTPEEKKKMDEMDRGDDKKHNTSPGGWDTGGWDDGGWDDGGWDGPEDHV